MKIKAIKITLTMANGRFANGTNQKIIYSTSLENYLHIQATINRNTAINGNNLTLTIFGMTVEDCNALAIINPDSLSSSGLNTQVELSAGYINPTPQANGSYDQKEIMNQCDNLMTAFLGVVISGSPNYNDPNRPFIIQAQVAGASSYKLINATVGSEMTFSQFVSEIIDKENKTKNIQRYQLGKVTPDTQVSNGVYNGTFANQLMAICHDYGYNYWQLYQANKIILDFTQIGIQPSTISDIIEPDKGDYTGMIGYPMSATWGIQVQTFFNPYRQCGSSVELISNAKIYNGKYIIWTSQSELSTQDTAWQSVLTLYRGMA